MRLEAKRLLIAKTFALGARARSGMSAALTMLLAVASYLIFAPVWSPRLMWSRYDNARLLEIALLVLVGIVAAFPGASRALCQSWSRLGRAAQTLLVAFLMLGAVSAALSSAPQVGALQISISVLLIALVLTLGGLLHNEQIQVEQALSVAVCAGALLLVLQFWAEQAIYLAQQDAFPWISPFLNFANVRFFSQYQSYTLLVLLLPLGLFRLPRGAKLMLYFLAANFWSLQWMVGTRAVWAGFLVAFLAVLIFGGKHRANWIGQQSIGLAGGLAIFLVFTRLLMPSAEAPEIPKQHSVVERGWKSVNERVIMIKGATEMIGQHPVLGVGPGQFGHNYSATRAAHPHNIALQFLAEYGLLGGGAAIALLTLLGLCAVGVIRTAGTYQHGIVDISLAAALLMGLVDSCFSGNLTMPHSQILFAVTAGWLLARRVRLTEAAPYVAASIIGHQTQLVLRGVILLAVAVAFILTFEYVHAIEGMGYWLQPKTPNLWQDGRFSAW